MQTIADVVIIHVVAFAVCFAFLVYVNQRTKAAPLPSSAALDLTLPAASLPAFALPATEAYLAPKSASPLLGSCRLHPFIEGKLPLSPKAVEPSYEAWVPQDPPQRPGYGLLIPKSQPRPRRQPGGKLLVARPRVRWGDGPVLALAPLKPSVAFVPRWSGRLIKPARRGDSTFATLVGKEKTVGVGSSAALQQQQQPQQQQQQQQHFAPSYQPPSDQSSWNPLLEMSNAAADDKVIEWLGKHVATNEPLLDRCRRDTNTISEIAQVFKLWEEWVKIEGSWDFEKGVKTGMDGVLALVETTCSSLEGLSTMNAETCAFVEKALSGVTRMRDGLQWARQGN
jgi:hypothetical protein